MTKEKDIALSPLADPVISAIFANKEVAGLAAESLIRATLNADNQSISIGKILSVTPQRSHIDAISRSCRVDVEVESTDNEIVIFEVEMNPNDIIVKRDLFSASRIFTETSSKGDTANVMALNMPKVIYINILNFNIREDNTDALQPFKIVYTKPPIVTAVSNFSGYNVQLPRILEMEPDFTNDFYCWYFTIYTAHVKNRTIQEVIEMTPQLQEYASQDIGYRQFCDQYKLAASDPATRKEYYFWFDSQIMEEGRRMASKRIGREEGIGIGMEKGIGIGIEKSIGIGIEKERQRTDKERRETLTGSIRRMTNMGMDDPSIAEALDLAVSEINDYR